MSTTPRPDELTAAPEQVVLLHGMGCGPWVWESTRALLSPGLVAHVPVIAGHHEGTRLVARSEQIASEQMADDLERQLDALGLDRAHLVGNSLGGWLALRLAERGRALSVLCLAPAGGWHPGSAGERLLTSRFVLGHRVARRLSRTPAVIDRAWVRRRVLSQVLDRPELVSPEQARMFVRDLAQCQALRAAIENPEARRLTRIRTLSAPTTIAWAEHDRVLSGAWARRGFAHLAADTTTIAGAGHMPMIDAPISAAALIEKRVSSARQAR